MREINQIYQNKLKRGSSKPGAEMTRRELLNRLSPLGKVELDSSKCTGCGLCALECPTGALTVSPVDEKDSFRLLFKHGKCVACNRCVEICPEKGLNMERTLEPEKI
ncbi:MAG: 4Fe-4S binding protein, partial [Chloroflexota bacterium]